MKKKRFFAGILAVVMMTSAVALTGCGNTTQAKADSSASKNAVFSTPRQRLSLEAEDSPEWVTKLEAAKSAKQLFVVAVYEHTTAWVSIPCEAKNIERRHEEITANTTENILL